MRVAVINVDEDILSHLSDRWLTRNGRIKLLPAEEFRAFPHEYLMAWCNKTARYGIPTVELVYWLLDRIGGRKAIEIGSGNGDLGYHLRIPETDSYIQQRPELKAYYHMAGQVPAKPLKGVYKYDAIAAIKKARPKVVIGSWITRKFIEGKEIVGVSEASAYGTIEEEILQRCETYIHIGNRLVHSEKTILSLPHEEFQFPWLVSRGMNQDANVIYIWENRHE